MTFKAEFAAEIHSRLPLSLQVSSDVSKVNEGQPLTWETWNLSKNLILLFLKGFNLKIDFPMFCHFKFD